MHFRAVKFCASWDQPKQKAPKRAKELVPRSSHKGFHLAHRNGAGGCGGDMGQMNTAHGRRVVVLSSDTLYQLLYQRTLIKSSARPLMVHLGTVSYVHEYLVHCCACIFIQAFYSLVAGTMDIDTMTRSAWHVYVQTVVL